MFSASALVVTLAFFGLLGFALYRLSPGRLPSVEQDARPGRSRTAPRSPSPMSPASTRPKTKCRRSSSSCASRGGLAPSAAASPRACCSSARRARARRCWRARLPARRACRSCSPAARTSSRCLPASAPSRVRKLFKEARKHPSCIVFIDELDAVGPQPRQPVAQPRRARADAEPAARRDGRLRAEPGHRRHRGDQPAGHPRQGAAAARALRPAGDGGQPGPARPRGDSRACTRARCRSGRTSICGGRARHARLLRRRPGQPDERSGAARGAGRPPRPSTPTTSSRRATRC